MKFFIFNGLEYSGFDHDFLSYRFEQYEWNKNTTRVEKPKQYSIINLRWQLNRLLCLSVSWVELTAALQTESQSTQRLSILRNRKQNKKV